MLIIWGLRVIYHTIAQGVGVITLTEQGAGQS